MLEQIIQKFKNIPTTCISDALKGLSNMNSTIKPLSEQYRLCGPAYTVSILANDNLALLKALSMAKPGDVLVIDAKGYEYNCVAGDFVIGMAKVLGLAGFVIDGVIRDLRGVKALEFPVFCKGTTIAAGGKVGVGAINVPISCGGVHVSPGDIIVGDADGIVVVPTAQAFDIVAWAQHKEQQDRERTSQVLQTGETVRAYLDSILAGR